MSSLLSPGIIVSVLLATLCGAAFHTWRGGGYTRLLFYLLAAWAGFALGQVAAWLSGWQLLMIGQVHLLEGLLGCLLLLVLTSWVKLK